MILLNQPNRNTTPQMEIPQANLDFPKWDRCWNLESTDLGWDFHSEQLPKADRKNHHSPRMHQLLKITLFVPNDKTSLKPSMTM